MKTAERRKAIFKALCRRRQDTTENLASEFGVSERTIRRDIEALCDGEPIFTMTGRHGGIFLVEGFNPDRRYLSEKEVDIILKAYELARSSMPELIDTSEFIALLEMVQKNKKPAVKKKGNQHDIQ